MFNNSFKFEILPKNEEKILSAEEFCQLSKNPDVISKIKSVDFSIDDDPNDFGTFKVTYKNPFDEDNEWLNQM